MRITPEDIAERIWCRNRFFPKDPEVFVTGTPGSFGKIVLEFTQLDGKKLPVGWNIWVSREDDIKQYAEAVEEAIRNYDKYANAILEHG